MQTLRTAILEHTTATGVHHDWLIEDPRLQNPKAPDTRLWTARVKPPPQDWPLLHRFSLTVIPPHRRIYLNYQGDVPGSRGHVRRLASGGCKASKWSVQCIVLTLDTQVATLNLRLTQQAHDHWLAEQL